MNAEMATSASSQRSSWNLKKGHSQDALYKVPLPYEYHEDIVSFINIFGSGGSSDITVGNRERMKDAGVRNKDEQPSTKDFFANYGE